MDGIMAKPRLVTSLLTGLLFAVGAVGTIDAQRIQDIARVEGVRNRQLKGYGLVLGLPGTGDNSRNLLTRKLYQGLLKNLDIDLSEDSIKSKNVAVVMVTATVSSWMKTGAEFDVERRELPGVLVARGVRHRVELVAEGLEVVRQVV